MSLQGTAIKSALLLCACFAAAIWVWIQFNAGNRQPQAILPYMLIGGLGGFVLAMATIFVPRIVAYTAIPYALLEGLFLGGISSMFEIQFPGIALQAVGLTFGTFLTMLAAYMTGFIRPTENFKLGVVSATGGIFLIYLVSIVMGFFGTSIPFIHSSGPIGIGFSLIVVTVAALNLVLDFDFIEHGAEHGAPKNMEWYGAFGLLITLVWLYIEILHLLAKLNRR